MGKQSSLLVPIALLVIGIGGLLSTSGVAPGVNWVWVLLLAALGVLVFVRSGVDKLSVVLGPMFLVASLLSILRQTGRLSLDIEIPILIILLGVLMLIARLPRIRAPSWIDQVQPPSD